MKILVLYDSVFGNTKKIAEAVADGFRELKADCTLLHASQISAETVSAADLLVIGSPTRAFHATDAVVKAVKNADLAVTGKRFAAFDTRVDPADIKSGFLRKIVTSFGYAADQVAKLMQKRGAVSLVAPMGFYVTNEDGPRLRKNEPDNAFLWAKTLLETAAKP